MPNIFDTDRNFGRFRDRIRNRRKKPKLPGDPHYTMKIIDPEKNIVRMQKEKGKPISANKGGLIKSGVTSYKDIHDMENGG